MEGEGDDEEQGREEAEEGEDAEGSDGEEEQAPAPPPPRRQPSLLAPLQMGSPLPAGQQMSPVTAPGRPIPRDHALI